MNEFIDAIELFAGIVKSLRQNQVNPHSPLEEMVLKACGTNLAYVDNRKDAKEKFGFDFWEGMKKQFNDEENFKNFIKMKGINERTLYSKSEQFPDFIFKVKRQENELICGSLLELKDSNGASIASFNSTLPTRYKSLDEVDLINGNNFVSRITSIMDGELASDKNYRTYQRRNFYLIRTHKGKDDKVKISIVDGSFFETVPKEHLIYQMFLNILRDHLKKKDINIPSELMNKIEKSLSYITDQTIIAASQTIEKASVRPRLRIMAEVHPEGNPHSSFYPKILERTVNLIIQSSLYNGEIIETISNKIPDINVFTIQHKRNGEHLVFQVKF
jgi:hypothetical protein